jgi:hypothetical protein
MPSMMLPQPLQMLRPGTGQPRLLPRHMAPRITQKSQSSGQHLGFWQWVLSGPISQWFVFNRRHA